MTQAVVAVPPPPAIEALTSTPQPSGLEAKPEKAACKLGSGYPEEVTRWCSLIRQYADQYSIDPVMIGGLVWYESGGNPEAYSRSGAVGLMQVMPRDGLAAAFRCPNGPCFASRPTTQELKDPTFNVEYGVRMLAGLIEKYGLRDALKRYGPANYGYRYADKVLAITEQHR